MTVRKEKSGQKTSSDRPGRGDKQTGLENLPRSRISFRKKSINGGSGCYENGEKTALKAGPEERMVGNQDVNSGA